MVAVDEVVDLGWRDLGEALKDQATEEGPLDLNLLLQHPLLEVVLGAAPELLDGLEHEDDMKEEGDTYVKLAGVGGNGQRNEVTRHVGLGNETAVGPMSIVAQIRDLVAELGLEVALHLLEELHVLEGVGRPGKHHNRLDEAV